MSHHIKSPAVTIAPVENPHCALGLGCWVFGGAQWGGQEDADSMSAMQAALDLGITHFDTAAGYGAGRSEMLVGEFLRERREEVFLATKFFPSQQTAEFVLGQLDKSLEHLQTDYVDLYYIHWPLTGKDLRPVMEGLEQARAAGKIKAIGVSNFNVADMESVSEVGRIDAHQLCYNLFWRYPERDVIPWCREHGVAVVTYSSIAQGILTGKFPRHPEFREGDQRGTTLYFAPEIWPHVYAGVEQLKALAASCERELTHLAIRWVLEQPGIVSELVGAREGNQMRDNAAALDGDIASEVFAQMTAISEEVMSHIPDQGNIFGFHP
jgi:aryl-alcohol dehydrogenase-like predicted oxidoreductase